MKTLVFFWGITLLLLFNSVVLTAQLKPLGEIPPTAQKAYVGFYLINVHDMDMRLNSFYVDFYVWARWKGDINPFEGMEFANGVDDWGRTVEDLVDTIQVDDEGYNYFIQRIEGRFYHAFTLERYPLDNHEVTIQLENSQHELDKLVLLPDTAHTRYREELYLPGWEIFGWSMDSRRQSYATNFGDLSLSSKTQYSNVVFKMNLGRPGNYFLWKLLLPLLVVLFSSIGAFFLHPKYTEARISLPLSALLTAVFLQESYTNNLPDISYMVLMDKIYVLCYLLIIVGIMETIAMANLAIVRHKNTMEQVRRIDKLFFKGQMITLILGLLLLIGLS